jgi:hypothetical protein
MFLGETLRCHETLSLPNGEATISAHQQKSGASDCSQDKRIADPEGLVRKAICPTLVIPCAAP